MFFVLGFVSESILSQAQGNLVPNPSFEYLINCPTQLGQIFLAQPWFSPNKCTGGTLQSCSSSDVYSTCFSPIPMWDNAGVPSNSAGFQYPRTGNNYAGIGFWVDNGTREYISTPLTQKLVQNKGYCITFYVSNTDEILFDSFFTATSNIHLTFSPDSLFSYNAQPITLNPAIQNNQNELISDTINWIKIEGCYIANGTELFLTIGNFFNNSQSTVADTNSSTAYYYIDDVSVLECDLCNNPIPNFFTPNNDGINDLWQIELKTGDEIVIYNRWGQKIKTLSSNDNYWDGNNCNDGAYYFIGNINKEAKNGFIQLIR